MNLALCVQTPEVEPILPVALLSGAFEDKLAKAARLGADGVELMAVDPARLEAAEVRAALARHGLQVAAIGSGGVKFATGLTLLHAQPECAEQALRRLQELIDLAAALGAPLVTVGSLRGTQAPVGPDGRARLVEALRRACTHAASRGVRLVVEPLNRYEADLINNAEQGLAFVNEVSHPALGLLLDTFHVNIEEASWTEPFRRVMAAGRLWHVHLGDNNRLPPGQGLIDFAAIVRTLRQIGYTGWLSAELLARPDPDTAAEQTIRHMRPLLTTADAVPGST